MVSDSPFTANHIQEWASFGPKSFGKPTSQSEIEARGQRSAKVSEMKKRLAKELNCKRWSERWIEKELDRLADEFLNKKEDEEDTRPDYIKDNHHPDNKLDHRPQGGPLLEYLWSQQDPPLQGQTLYLGGEVAGKDQKIYLIPGHADKVLVIDPNLKEVYPMGPSLTSNGRLYKWLRGIVIGDIIYGLPCHAEDILKIDTVTGSVTKIPIPYETFYPDNPEKAEEQRKCIWKYHGGAISPIDGAIYAIPQRAERVLKFDPETETSSLVGPSFPGKCKWYGGIIGKQDGAIYGIPQNAIGVLRIHPTEGITVHGDFGTDNHKWHGGAAADNGVIVSVPANADTVLCVTPASPEPQLQILKTDDIQSGRHRDDGKYKYLGAMCGPNGKVYIFPCASEYVLQVDTESMVAKNIGPNLRDSGMETVYQNKWQNGLTCYQDQCVYGITLSGHTLLRIDCSKDATDKNDNGDPEITTWLLPPPRRACRDKFEGGVMTASGVMYTVPNNHKGVLRIEPANLTKGSISN